MVNYTDCHWKSHYIMFVLFEYFILSAVKLCQNSYVWMLWHSCSLWDKPGWLTKTATWMATSLWEVIFLNPKGTHMHGLAVYVKEGLPFAWDLSLENSADCYLCFQLALLLVSYFFFLHRSPSLSLCMVFDSISSNIDNVLSINPSANVFVFGYFNIHHKNWLSYSGRTDWPGELCYNFSFSNDLTQMVNFLLGSQTVTLIVLLFWIYFFLLMLVFVLQWLSLHWEILIMLLSQFPLTFDQIHNGMLHFIT